MTTRQRKARYRGNVVHSCDTGVATGRALARWIALGAAAGLAACAPNAPPPDRLGGDWGRSAAACAAGFVVRFGDEAVTMRAADIERPLLDRPEYTLLPGGRIQIAYTLPAPAGRLALAPGEGVVTLAPAADGGLRLSSHFYRDGLTGAVRMSLQEDETGLGRLLAVERCSGPALGDALRGRD